MQQTVGSEVDSGSDLGGQGLRCPRFQDRAVRAPTAEHAVGADAEVRLQALSVSTGSLRL